MFKICAYGPVRATVSSVHNQFIYLLFLVSLLREFLEKSPGTYIGKLEFYITLLIVDAKIKIFRYQDELEFEDDGRRPAAPSRRTFSKEGRKYLRNSTSNFKNINSARG